jgi:sodium transport system permease protein
MLRYGPLPAIGIPFLFGLPQYGRFLVVLLPLILLCPAVLLYVGMRGRSVKEAQANVSVLLFVASVLPVAQMFMQRKEPEWLSLVPVASQYSLLARVLRGDALPFQIILNSTFVPVLLTAAALLLTARLLSKEAVLASR